MHLVPHKTIKAKTSSPQLVKVRVASFFMVLSLRGTIADGGVPITPWSRRQGRSMKAWALKTNSVMIKVFPKSFARFSSLLVFYIKYDWTTSQWLSSNVLLASSPKYKYFCSQESAMRCLELFASCSTCSYTAVLLFPCYQHLSLLPVWPSQKLSPPWHLGPTSWTHPQWLLIWR